MATPPDRTSREIRTARVGRRPPGFVVTLIALGIVFALAWVFFLRSGPAAPAPVVGGAQGAYSWRGTGGAGEDGTFSAVAGGNAGGTSTLSAGVVSNGGTPPDSAYDAGTRTETTTGGAGALSSCRRTVGAWPPVWRVATHSPLDYQGLAAVVRTAVADRDHDVGIKPLKDGDRDVWRAALQLDGKTIELVVDQQTGLVTWYTDGDSTFTATVDWASPPPRGSTYTVDARGLPPATTVDHSATYFASAAAAGRAAGYDPLVSDLAPDGFASKAIAALAPGWKRASSWLAGAPGGAPRGEGPREPAVAELFVRGLSWFTVEQLGPQAMRFSGAELRDRLDAVAGDKLSYQAATLQYGAFAGRRASTWYQASGPTLYVAGPHRAVFVTGALTRDELIAFAEGLTPATAAGPASSSPTAAP